LCDALHLMMPKFALGYAAIVLAAAIWAWGDELANYGSEREHLLPPIVLAVASLPTSLVGLTVCTPANGYCGEYGQLAVDTACGAVQAAAILLVARWLKPVRTEKSRGPA
jgi:hypothetical protein